MSCPPTAGVAVRPPQDRSRCCADTWRAGQHDGGSQRQDPSRGPPCCPRTSPHLYNLSLLSLAQPPAAQVFLSWGCRPCPVDSGDRKHSRRSSCTLKSPSCSPSPFENAPLRGRLAAHSLSPPLRGGCRAEKWIQRGPWGLTHSVPENTKLLSQPKEGCALPSSGGLLDSGGRAGFDPSSTTG